MKSPIDLRWPTPDSERQAHLRNVRSDLEVQARNEASINLREQADELLSHVLLPTSHLSCSCATSTTTSDVCVIVLVASAAGAETSQVFEYGIFAISIKHQT